MIQWGTPEEAFTRVAVSAALLEEKLQQARAALLVHYNVDQYRQDCTNVFSDKEITSSFESNRTNPWLRPITVLFDQLKRAINHLCFDSTRRKEAAEGTFFKPFKVGTDTAQIAQEYEQGIKALTNKKGG